MFRLLGFAFGLATLGAIGWAFLHAPPSYPIIGALGALGALSLTADGLTTGSVWARGGEVHRAEAPVSFVLACGSYAALAVLMAAVALYA